MRSSTSTSAWVVWLLLLVSLVAGCKSGTSGVLQPALRLPVITSVTPSGTVGSAGSVVQFHGTATNTPTSWQWTFGGGALTNESTADPHVTLGSIAGTFTGTARATNEDGTSLPRSFSFVVIVPPPPSPHTPTVTSVSPTGVVGSIGGWVRFHATATNNPVSWEWNFGSGGTTAENVSDPRVELSGTSGGFSGTVRAQNAEGTSDPVPFAFDVVSDPQPPRWETVTLPFDKLYPLGVLIAHDRLYVTDGLQLASVRSSQVADPSAWSVASFPGHFSGIVGAPLMSVGEGLLAVFDTGRLGPPGYRTLGIAYTATPTPSQPDDWQTYDLQAGAVYSLYDIHGTPVLAYEIDQDFSAVGGPQYEALAVSIAQKVPPTSAADWQEEIPWATPWGIPGAAFAGAPLGGGLSLAHEEYPSGKIVYAYRSDLTGQGASRWTQSALDPDPNRVTALAVLSDRVVASIRTFDAPPAWKLAYSSTPTGIGGVWNKFEAPGALPQGADYFYGGSLQVWGGRLIGEAQDPNGLSVMRVLGPDLTASPSTAIAQIVSIPTAGSNPQLTVAYTAMTTAGKDLYLLFCDRDPDRVGPLRLAIPEGSW